MLPDTIRVIVRDWITANHVLATDDRQTVLIDAGHVTRTDETLSLLAPHLGSRGIDRIVLTHCHSDHMGGCAALRRSFGSRITIPVGEADAIRTWDTRALWLDFSGQVAEPFGFDDVMSPGDRFGMGGFEWEAIAVPGHDMGALAFWCSEARVLISGDALWENGFGIVLPGDDWKERLAAARDSLLRVRSLGARVVIPGHGEPFTGTDEAISRCLSRVAAFEQDEHRLARHALKVMLVYFVMERRTLPRVELVDTLSTVPMFVEYDREYFHLGSGVLVARLLDELLGSNVLALDAADALSAP